MPIGSTATLAGFSVVIFLVAEWNRSRTRRAKSWKQTPGRIVLSRIVEVDDDGSTGYAPEIEYHYVVEGLPYTSRRICFGSIGSGSDTVLAEIYLEKFPQATEATVYYDPKKPSRAVLLVETGYGERGLYMAAFFLLLWSLYLLWKDL